MRNIISLLALFLILNGTVSGQSTSIENLQSSLSKSKEDRSKIAMLNKISVAYLDNDPNRSIHYAEEALLLSKKLHSDIAQMHSLNKLGFALFVVGNYSRGLKISLQGLTLAQKLKNSTGKITAYNNIGNIYRRQGNYQGAISNFLLAKDFLKTEKNLPSSNIKSTLGICYLETGQTDSAMVYLQNAYQHDTKSKSKGISITYNRMGD